MYNNHDTYTRTYISSFRYLNKYLSFTKYIYYIERSRSNEKVI